MALENNITKPPIYLADLTYMGRYDSIVCEQHNINEMWGKNLLYLSHFPILR